MATTHEEDLRNEIAGGGVVCVVGAGLSIATSKAKLKFASWKDLLESGLDEFCKA